MERTLPSAFMQQNPAELGSSIKGEFLYPKSTSVDLTYTVYVLATCT